jgi:hypothetical protein
VPCSFSCTIFSLIYRGSLPRSELPGDIIAPVTISTRLARKIPASNLRMSSRTTRGTMTNDDGRDDDDVDGDDVDDGICSECKQRNFDDEQEFGNSPQRNNRVVTTVIIETSTISRRSTTASSRTIMRSQ